MGSKMKIENKELNLITESSLKLAIYGEVEILYVTAEFQPFSNQHKPDLKFIPNNSKDIFFIEYKSHSKKDLNKNYVESIVEHKSFLVEDTLISINYAFATDNDIDHKLVEFLNNKGITVFESVNDSDNLVDKILNWSNNEK